jgi:hypothetical protein
VTTYSAVNYRNVLHVACILSQKMDSLWQKSSEKINKISDSHRAVVAESAYCLLTDGNPERAQWTSV